MNSNATVDSCNAKLLTVAEVMAMLDVSRSYVDRVMATGELKRVKFGKAVRFRPSDVDIFIEKNMS